MISIRGDFKKGKEVMKEIRKGITKDIRELERIRHPSYQDQNEIVSLQHKLEFYSVSMTLPATINGKVINGKLLQSFVKKLKGFQYEIIDQEDSILLQYGKKPNEWTGRLVLYDISKYYQDFTDIPKLEIPERS